MVRKEMYVKQITPIVTGQYELSIGGNFTSKELSNIFKLVDSTDHILVVFIETEPPVIEPSAVIEVIE